MNFESKNGDKKFFEIDEIIMIKMMTSLIFSLEGSSNVGVGAKKLCCSKPKDYFFKKSVHRCVQETF